MSDMNRTMIDYTRLHDADGKVKAIIEIMNRTNDILTDMVVKEANSVMVHTTTQRTSLPTAEWRKLNSGVSKGKSTTKQISDSLGMLETYSEVDKKLIDLSKDKATAMMSEEKAFIEGMSQQMAQTIFYGNELTNPASFTGFTPRFNSLADTHVVSAGGNTPAKQTSIWFVSWGDESVCGLYPTGSKQGIEVGKSKEETLSDSDGKLYEGYRTHYQWDLGLSVRDPRHVSRLCNIELSSLPAAPALGDSLLDKMLDAYYRLHSSARKNNKLSIYCNTEVFYYLHLQAKNTENVRFLDIDKVAGVPVVTFLGRPIREVEELLTTESVVA